MSQGLWYWILVRIKRAKCPLRPGAGLRLPWFLRPRLQWHMPRSGPLSNPRRFSASCASFFEWDGFFARFYKNYISKIPNLQVFWQNCSNMAIYKVYSTYSECMNMPKEAVHDHNHTEIRKTTWKGSTRCGTICKRHSLFAISSFTWDACR